MKINNIHGTAEGYAWNKMDYITRSKYEMRISTPTSVDQGLLVPVCKAQDDEI
jgi:hypothetical protein